MKFNSYYPPICIQSVVDDAWYIVANGWHKVSRKYEWSELQSMWQNPNPIDTTIKRNNVRKEWKVKGSSTYVVSLNASQWSCTCPAYAYGRGKLCKHIFKIKNETNYEKTN